MLIGKKHLIGFICTAVLLFSSTVFAANRTLHLVTSLDPLEAGEYLKEFEKDTGIKVEWIRLSAGEVVARLMAEGDNSSQSVWFGAPAPEFSAAAKKGLLVPYSPKGAGAIPKKWNDENNYYSGIYFGAIAFITNKNWIEKTGKQAPQSWQDLLSPDFKDNLAIAYPYTAGTGYTILAGLISLFGEDGAYEYWKKFDSSVRHYTKSGSSPIVEVGLGETRAGVVFAQDAVRKGIARGFPIVLTYPKEGTPYEIGGAAIIKGGPETKEAQAFLDWIVSLPAQNLFHKFGRSPLHPKATQPKDIKGPSEIKVVEMNMHEMGEKKSAYIDRWRRELKQ